MTQLSEEHLSDIDNVLTPGVRETIELLHQRGKSVYVISGGFRRLIEPLAKSLDIESENVYCNELLFNDKGKVHCFYALQDSCIQYTCIHKPVHVLIVFITTTVHVHDMCRHSRQTGQSSL